jgi:hypothetical protein
MRKSTSSSIRRDIAPYDGPWLDLEALARVEITSEQPGYPIESALQVGGEGWRASAPGMQTIRFFFDAPQQLHRIRLHFVEPAVTRTQEYVLRWSSDGGRTFRDIVRQQWNFSPQGSTSQTEEHRVELPAVDVLELSVIPDTSGGSAVASLAQLRIV